MADQPKLILNPATTTTVELPARRVFELRVDCTAYLPGELTDWPPNIQDGIYAAMERLCKTAALKKIYILQSRCGRDVKEEPYHIIVTVVEDNPKRIIINELAN